MHETLLPKWLALPVFASDPLSSVAYATEEIVLVLAGGGKWPSRTLGLAPTAGQHLHRAVRVGGLFTLLLILRAFASGCTALTGVEAISNGVPAFRHPKARNAANTLAAMGALSITMF